MKCFPSTSRYQIITLFRRMVYLLSRCSQRYRGFFYINRKKEFSNVPAIVALMNEVCFIFFHISLKLTGNLKDILCRIRLCRWVTQKDLIHNWSESLRGIFAKVTDRISFKDSWVKVALKFFRTAHLKRQFHCGANKRRNRIGIRLLFGQRHHVVLKVSESLERRNS